MRRILIAGLILLVGCQSQKFEPIPEEPLPVIPAGREQPTTAPTVEIHPIYAAAMAEPVMVAHCINVGQGDATLLEFPCGAMMIDAGGQDAASKQYLLSYLDRFFANRPDLNRTIDTIILTHNHPDHTMALREVIEKFKVLHFVDNGQLSGAGTEDPKWLRQNNHTDGRDISIREVSESDITSLPAKTGLTGNDIDPVACSICDPKISILTGRLDTNPGWSIEDFDNKNNHSLIVRIDFGKSAFLFSGDQQERAIDKWLDYYSGTTKFDADVWHVGHHGSHNSTTQELLDALTPKAAVISMGKWDYGMGGFDRFTTWWYGHPRRATVELLAKKITRTRSQSAKVMVADGAGHFTQYTVRKAIYGTGWDGTIKVFATWFGDLRVTRNN